MTRETSVEHGKMHCFVSPKPTAEDNRPRDPSDLACIERRLLLWAQYGGNTYECEVWVEPEEEGGFYAFAARLPGVVAQGEDLEAALSQIEQALRATLASYIERKKPIPWSEEPTESEEGRSITKRWLLVDV